MYMKSVIRNGEIEEKLIPKWGIGCRRLSPGQPYLEVSVSRTLPDRDAEYVRHCSRRTSIESTVVSKLSHQRDAGDLTAKTMQRMS